MFSTSFPDYDYLYSSNYNRFGQRLPDRPIRISPPAALFDLDTAREACGIMTGPHPDDALITTLSEAAVQKLDAYNGILGGRALVSQVWQVKTDFWLQNGIFLPLTPILSVSSVKYYDTDNAQQTLPAANYYLAQDADGYKVLWSPNTSAPQIFQRNDAVIVTFTAGYGSPSDVPAPLRAAALLKLRMLYAEIKRNPTILRETAFGVGMTMYATTGQNASSIDAQIEDLISGYRVGGGI